MSEPPLSQEELHATLLQPEFAIGAAACLAHAEVLGFEGSFTLQQSREGISVAESHLPKSADDNYGLHPSNAVAIQNPGTAVAIFHSHPFHTDVGNIDQGMPSRPDVKLMLNPEGPEHRIHGVIHRHDNQQNAQRAMRGIVHLFRADTYSPRQQTKFFPLDLATATFHRQVPAYLQTLGISYAHIELETSNREACLTSDAARIERALDDLFGKNTASRTS